MARFALLLASLSVICYASAEMTHSSALSQLKAAGITISSSGGCSDRTVKSCTSLDGIRKNTIDGLVTLRKASGCPINVTGGTEIGHAKGTYSHGTGYKADISLNTCINNYITTRFANAGKRGDGAQLYKAASGNLYAKEGNHWDILFY